jgi:DNA-binding HxlR family transcriptional regulator
MSLPVEFVIIRCRNGQSLSLKESIVIDNKPALKRDDAKLIDYGLSVLSPRWTSEILIDLSDGAKRTTQLLRDLKGVSAKTLCQRLRRLSELGLVSRATFAEVPPRVEYSLTEKGRNLTSILHTLRELGIELSLKTKLPEKFSGESEMDDFVLAPSTASPAEISQ